MVGTHGGQCPRNTTPVGASGVFKFSRCFSDGRVFPTGVAFVTVVVVVFFVVAVGVAAASPSVSADAVVVDVLLLGSLLGSL